jgi:DNA (cytosine-5)-methyltransferase 1
VTSSILEEDVQLVLSLFPGADLFGMAFEEFGFCVVRGPDILFGRDVRDFQVPAGKFEGIIGGPPCKVYSYAAHGQVSNTENQIPEFARLVLQAQPRWWVMENIAAARDPEIPNWHKVTFNAYDVGCPQYRVRSFWSNLVLDIEKSQEKIANPWPTVLATEYKYGGGGADRRRAGRRVGRRMTMEEVNVAMGLPSDFSTPALSLPMQYEVRGNGVPQQMGRAVAKAVLRATGGE